MDDRQRLGWEVAFLAVVLLGGGVAMLGLVVVLGLGDIGLGEVGAGIPGTAVDADPVRLQPARVVSGLTLAVLCLALAWAVAPREGGADR